LLTQKSIITNKKRKEIKQTKEMPIHAHALQATQATALKWCQDENQELRQELYDLNQDMERLREENKTLKEQIIQSPEGVPPPSSSVPPAPQ
tara:strand:- start:8972 stop:9247 length:276 start_codon:yes stop_codon:yes gene_type:complete